MTAEPHVIRIADYLTDQSRALVGVKRGTELRKKTQIDRIDERAESIKIVIPRGIWVINHTYWQGFLCNVVKRHGKVDFLKKYQIVSDTDLDFNRQLMEAISIILRDGVSEC